MNKSMLNVKKLHILQIGIIILFFIFLIFIITPKNYQKNYSKNNILITEKYHKNDKTYYFTFKYQDITFDYLLKSKYKRDRGLITDIKITKDDNDNFCLIPKSKEINTIPMCYINNTKIHYTLANKELKSKFSNILKTQNKLIENYQDIEIYDKDFTYLLWNYDGFYYISPKINKKINIFNSEMYNVNLITYMNNNLVIADYDSNYTFNTLYTIDFKKGNLKKHELDRNIYFDSYFLGTIKNKLYLIDNKERVMYEINLKKNKVDKTPSKMYKNNEWINVNIKTLLNQKQEFIYPTNTTFTLDNHKLYLNYKEDSKTLIAKNVTSIIRIKDEDIFYLKEDTLYHFNNQKGETKLLTYFEWNFNSNNMIYVN